MKRRFGEQFGKYNKSSDVGSCPLFINQSYNHNRLIIDKYTSSFMKRRFEEDDKSSDDVDDCEDIQHVSKRKRNQNAYLMI